MITDEEIAAIEAKCRYSPDGKRFVIDKRQRDRAIYQLGRQHQRESDAALCRDGINIDGGRSNGKVFTYPRLAEAILANTGDK